MLFLTPEGAKLVQKYLGRTWAAFLLTAAVGGSIGNMHSHPIMLTVHPGYAIHKCNEKQGGRR